MADHIDRTNQCAEHPLHAGCLLRVKADFEKLDIEHKGDIVEVYKKIDYVGSKIDGVTKGRIPNSILFPILTAMCIFALYLFDGAGESRAEIKRIVEKNTTTLETLKNDILPSLTRIENKLMIPENQQIELDEICKGNNAK